MKSHYSMTIQWSIEDEIYIVTLPEFGNNAHTHGDTYAEAIQHGEEVLELLIEEYQSLGRTLPTPSAIDLIQQHSPVKSSQGAMICSDDSPTEENEDLKSLRAKGIKLTQPTYQEIHKYLAEQIAREDGLMATRLSWLLTFEGFIFASFGFMSQKPNLGNFLLVIPVAGFLVAGLAELGIFAASEVLIASKKKWQNMFESSAFIRPFGDNSIHRFAMVYTHGIPVILMILWGIVFWILYFNK